MTTFSQRQIVSWIESIEAATGARCRSLSHAIAERRQHGEWTSGAVPPERLFAAFFTGDASRLDSPHVAATWASWIENQPFYLPLSTHPQVVIDLIPCDRAAFVTKYHCTPEQLVHLMRALPQAVRINVRNDDARSYAASEAVADAMGTVLTQSQHAPLAQCFYRLEPIRRSAFVSLEVDFDAHREHASVLCEGYAAVEGALSGVYDDLLPIATRNRAWPSRSQLVGRLTYYLTARALWPAHAPDPLVEEWIDGERPLSFDLQPAVLADRIARVTTTHHLFTAPLTGALGGTYNWYGAELDYALRARHARLRPAMNLPLSTWLFELQAGMTTLPAHRPAWAPARVRRAPTDDEWQSFVRVVETNRVAIQTYWSELETTFLRAGMRVDPGLRPDVDMDDFDRVVAAVEPSRLQGAWEECWRAGTDIAAKASAHSVADATHLHARLVTTGARLAGGACAETLQTARDAIDKAFWKRATRNALTRIASELDMPKRAR